MPEILCWVDLETTGDRTADSIIEVAIVLTDDSPRLVELDRYTAVAMPSGLMLDTMDPVVREMHTKSGLLAEAEACTVWAEEREWEILEFLRKTGLPSGRQFPLAGSGVGHFDRRYIARDWPAFNKRLTYWCYDVGVIRRTMRLALQPIADHVEKDHRALPDILDHIDEMRRYVAWMGAMPSWSTIREPAVRS